MWSKQAAELTWSQGANGITRTTLRDHPGGGRTYLVRLPAGVSAGLHRHQAEEEVFVLAGEVDIGGHVLRQGGFIFTEAGEAHDVRALEDSEILVSTSRPVEFL